MCVYVEKFIIVKIIYGLSANNNIKLSGAQVQRKTKGCIKLL